MYLIANELQRDDVRRGPLRVKSFVECIALGQPCGDGYAFCIDRLTKRRVAPWRIISTRTTYGESVWQDSAWWQSCRTAAPYCVAARRIADLSATDRVPVPAASTAE